MLEKIIRSDIQSKHAYPIADVPEDYIKLDAMEFPYTFSESMQQQLAQQLSTAAINRYPNPAKSGLQNQLRSTFNLPTSAQIVLGNGSDEIIQFLTLLVAQKNATVLAPEPSFVMYRHNAELFQLNYVGVPLNADFTLNVAATLAAIEQHQPELIFLSYPNNPTGVPFCREDVQAIIDAATGIIVIDEAYGAFSADSFLSQASSPEHLVVMRTLSKIGFAGLRLGYAVGSPRVMDELAKIMPPYNMNWLSLTAAKFALQHQSWLDQHITILIAEREKMISEISKLPNVIVFNSQANFITVRFADAEMIFNELIKNKILVKKLHGSHLLLNQCLRLTIGTPEQNDKVLRILRQSL